MICSDDEDVGRDPIGEGQMPHIRAGEGAVRVEPGSFRQLTEKSLQMGVGDTEGAACHIVNRRAVRVTKLRLFCRLQCRAYEVFNARHAKLA